MITTGPLTITSKYTTTQVSARLQLPAATHQLVPMPLHGLDFVGVLRSVDYALLFTGWPGSVDPRYASKVVTK